MKRSILFSLTLFLVFTIQNCAPPSQNSGDGAPSTNTNAVVCTNTLSMGAWTAGSANLAEALSWFGIANITNTVYILGGKDNLGNSSQESYWGSFDATGDISIWTASSTITPGRHGLSIDEHINGYIFYMGGGDGGVAGTTCGKSQIQGTYNLGSFNALAEGFGTPRAFHSTFTIWNDVYVVGGINGSDNVVASVERSYFLPVTYNLSNWTPVNSLQTARSHHASVTAQGYVYTIGGKDDSRALTSIEVASIDMMNFSIGSWTYTRELPRPLYGVTAVYLRGFLVVMGGTDGTNTYDTVYVAHIEPDGSLCEWQTNSMNTARSGHGSVWLADLNISDRYYIYSIGGESNNTVYSTMEYTTVDF